MGFGGVFYEKTTSGLSGDKIKYTTRGKYAILQKNGMERAKMPRYKVPLSDKEIEELKRLRAYPKITDEQGSTYARR